MYALRLTRRRLIGGLAAAALLGFATVAVPARADGSGEPTVFIDELAREAVVLAGDRSLDLDARTDKLRRLLDRGFDGEAISRFVLGRYWRRASDAEKVEFVALFRDFTALSYARRFDAYQGEKLTILGSSRQGGEPGRQKALVRSHLVRADGSKVTVDWRVWQAPDGWRIYDVVVEGVSMALTQRSEFASIIQRSGGRLDGLLDQLRRRTAGFATEAAAS